MFSLICTLNTKKSVLNLIPQRHSEKKHEPIYSSTVRNPALNEIGKNPRKEDILFSSSLVNLAGQLAKSFSAALVLTFLTVRFSLILISSLHFRSKILGATFLLFQNSELGSQVTVITQVDRLVCFSLGLLG